jgi:hypothetical protein
MATTVPTSFQPYVSEASKGTGLPSDVVAAQASEESGFNASAVSGAGAEGWLQFEPATYAAYAPQAGVSNGTEFNVADETKVYIVYMNDLIKQEGGSVFKALEAYNAGPGNLAAGAGYASTIMSNAGEPQNLAAGSASTTSVTSTDPSLPFPFNLIPIPGLPSSSGSSINSITGDVAGAIGNSFLSSIGISSTKDLFQRLGLILLGVALILVGIHLLGTSRSSTSVTLNESSNEDTGQATRTRTIKAPMVRSTRKSVTGGTAAKTGGALKTGAGEAVEAAAIA